MNENGIMTPQDMAIYILRETRDGNALDPTDLRLVQAAVNGHLTEAGEVAFYDLHSRVQAGYKKPWLHGIEHLTRCHEGYVYWRGISIDHWDQCLAEPGDPAGIKEGMELARRCLILEKEGKEITTTSVIWNWKEEEHQ